MSFNFEDLNLFKNNCTFKDFYRLEILRQGLTRQEVKNLLSEKTELIYAGRPESASPAVGSSRISEQQQKQLLKDAFSF